MTASRILTGYVGIAVLAGLAIWLTVEHEARLRLVQEHSALQQQLSRMADLIADNERLSNLLAQPKPSLPDDDSLELLQLRGESGVLRWETEELENVRNENRQAHAALQNAAAARAAATADYWPRDAWSFSGYATPDAALQTSFWAANNGDVKAMLASTTGEARKIIEEQVAGKTAEEAAIRAMDDISGLKSVRLLNREVQGNDTTILTALFEDRSGQTETVTLLMKKIGNDWKVSGPPQ